MGRRTTSKPVMTVNGQAVYKPDGTLLTAGELRVGEVILVDLSGYSRPLHLGEYVTSDGIRYTVRDLVMKTWAHQLRLRTLRTGPIRVAGAWWDCSIQTRDTFQ